MKHVVAYLFAFVLIVFAGAVIWFSRSNITLSHLCFAGGALALACALADLADFKQACETIAPYIPQIRGRDR